eukprot:6202620-Pleurochrysis_carterae.AAC.3
MRGHNRGHEARIAAIVANQHTYASARSLPSQAVASCGYGWPGKRILVARMRLSPQNICSKLSFRSRKLRRYLHQVATRT